MIHEIFKRYWFERIVLHIKKKGLISFLKNGTIFILGLLSPKKVGAIPFSYFFKKKRRLNKKFCDQNLLDFDDVNIERYFNYYLNTKKIESKPIVYSFGIGGQIKFEEILSEKFDTEVYCYDPTSDDFINNYSGRKKIKLFPYGIWNKDGKIKFYYRDGKKEMGASITNYFDADERDFSEELECYTLKTLIEKNNHTKIDILKMDIEGAAIDVLENILNDKIYPEQILAEFEFSESDNLNKEDIQKYNEFELRLKKLIDRLRSLNYKCYNMPRFTNHPYHSIEALFVKSH